METREQKRVFLTNLSLEWTQQGLCTVLFLLAPTREAHPMPLALLFPAPESCNA